MMKLAKMLKRNNKGFTLVELMVVVVIIGILVAIAIPLFNSTQDNAARKANASDIRILNGAVNMWRANNPTATEPTDVAGWKTALEGAGKYVQTWPTLVSVGGTASTLEWNSTSKQFACNPAANATP